jgi:hypothetical protein
MPNMFGDGLNLGGRLVFVPDGIDPLTADADLPLAAASRRAKVAENNQPLTQNRVYFLYNHFHNALSASATDASGTVVEHADFSVNRYTVGFERTLFGDFWSVEIRMPFADRIRYTGTEAPAQGDPLAISGGDIGNLAVLLKRVVLRTDRIAASIGVGVDIPTGSDVLASFDNYHYTMYNQAVHLLPYAGAAWTPGDRVFLLGFVQVDVPANGNRVDYYFVGQDTETLGDVYEQTLMYVDVAAGWWLHRNPRSPLLTGLAVVVEYHYTTTLQDAHTVTEPSNQAVFGNPINRMDVSNLTVGLHSELAHRTMVRVGGVFPVSSGDNRWFDAEVQVQVERRF